MPQIIKLGIWITFNLYIEQNVRATLSWSFMIPYVLYSRELRSADFFDAIKIINVLFLHPYNVGLKLLMLSRKQMNK